MILIFSLQGNLQGKVVPPNLKRFLQVSPKPSTTLKPSAKTFHVQMCVETLASSEPTFILISIRQSCRCVSTFSKDHCTGDPDLTALCLGGADIMSKCQYECVYYRLFRGGWQWLCEVELDDVGSQITSPRLTERWKRDKTSSVLTLCPAAALVNPPH